MHPLRDNPRHFEETDATTPLTPLELDLAAGWSDSDDVRPGTPEGRDAAVKAVQARITELGYESIYKFAVAKHVPYNTINRFVRGRFDWPRPRSRAQIEIALGWEPGTLAQIVRSVEGEPGDKSSPTEGGSGRLSDISDRLLETTPTSQSVLVGFSPGVLEGLSDAEAEEVRAAATLAALQRMREIRATRSGASNGPGDRGESS